VLPVVARSPGRASLQLALLLLGLAAVALTGMEVALFATGDVRPVWAISVYALVGLLYVGAGLLAWWRQPRGRIGALLVACGFSVLAASLGNTSIGPFTAVGPVAAELPIGVLLHLLLAFPTGRLPDRRSRVLACVGYVVTVGLEAPQYLFGDPASVPAALIIANRPDVVELAMLLQRCSGFVVILATALTLVGRWRAALRPGRRVFAAVSAYGTFTILFLTLSAIVARATGLDPLTLFEAQMLVVAGVPIAFLTGVLRGGFARTATVDELADWLGTAEGGRPALRDALAATLGDPSLELLFWLGEEHRTSMLRATRASHRSPAPVARQRRWTSTASGWSRSCTTSRSWATRRSPTRRDGSWPSRWNGNGSRRSYSRAAPRCASRGPG
jgi:hypothetical protein